ncbi:MAG: phosphohistidine phosphatase [Runella slithyformis]|jgi:phosphohistidine phosphatase|nr:MAG: phosphohistidine phosphatase [Runella slithyformis]TAF96637.1 MAG: phosphohistidine phosphatase [Runella sp.]TAG20970.1 MAG: phosphohistidine phosphatase [Cytophagales bacterium]TAG40127.1 MAG: phosphohistidine phosphatase [Cytophagia bacterium]TAF24713.1 MAG: phosphohistidine phosphatase [Runella slithyformis]
MKRQLLIVRHAKAEDGFSLLNDFDRQLTASGIIDASRMGKFLFEQGFKPDYMVSSLAPRALYTAQLMAEQLGFDPTQIQSTRQLYDEGPKAYLNALGNVPADSQLALIFGHNPDISYFAEYLTQHHLGSMSKGAVVVVDFEDLSWSEISARTGKFAGYHIPKTFRD